MLNIILYPFRQMHSLYFYIEGIDDVASGGRRVVVRPAGGGEGIGKDREIVDATPTRRQRGRDMTPY